MDARQSLRRSQRVPRRRAANCSNRNRDRQGVRPEQAGVGCLRQPRAGWADVAALEWARRLLDRAAAEQTCINTRLLTQRRGDAQKLRFLYCSMSLRLLAFASLRKKLANFTS